MSNVLASAMPHIGRLVAPREVEIVSYEIRIEMGVVYDNLEKRSKMQAHIQPITPQELKKYTDSTTDLARTYKFFFLANDARLLSSLQIQKGKSVIIFDGREYSVFGVRDWFAQNGWVCVYASQKSQ